MTTRTTPYAGVLPALVVALLLVLLASIRWGAVPIAMSDMIGALRALGGPIDDLPLDQRIFLTIRLPRALLTAFVGAALAMGGVLVQALFRNPIVEPGLIGTSSGAAFGASLYFVLGASLHLDLGIWTLPIAACIGGSVATGLVFGLAQSRDTGRSTAVGLLLTGIAINALCLSGVGFLSYIARDPQARSITFWSLGTLSGASWSAVLIVGTTTVLGLIVALRLARPLNALMLGEDEARYLGVDLRRLKAVVLLVNVGMVAVATAFTGVIAFVGLIVPHLLRLARGADNRFLLLAGALLGAVMLSIADLIARLLLSPAELPIGIVTSVVGVPILLLLLRRGRALGT